MGAAMSCCEGVSSKDPNELRTNLEDNKGLFAGAGDMMNQAEAIQA